MHTVLEISHRHIAQVLADIYISYTQSDYEQKKHLIGQDGDIIDHVDSFIVCVVSRIRLDMGTF